ncbi:Piso0_003418 [Millerozyma farinosa CBS 7064]|uniref:Piso0_003418 protein n=1 Tax=Pichia sorbitophila (strain ATCC MYA-4447 / BCRC 22081 / CBS 7064 / NBRC 10061 / NRRL Y-12695) TaxID=559304 RepID=G8YI18_PICSO|nr:Piso0_003418 [Millerozyma farinosa CBS 7064]CCE81070.1 Piso0_003418 [Millerozyma farinosa CBS 7064]
MTEDKKQALQDSGLIEWSVFSELVAMDEDEEGFSKSLFQTFVDQVLETFKEIDENLKNKNFDKVSSLGHYLKGSAAALGLEKISSQCERIQNYGRKNNFDNFEFKEKKEFENEDDKWEELIHDALDKARDWFVKSRKALNEYFEDDF